MSHTNQTTNYELSQFLGSDKPAWLVDYNGDMAKIDAQMKVNADAIAQNANDIDTIEGAIGVEGLAGRVTTLENDVTGIETAIGDTSIPTVAQTLTGAIAEIVNTDIAGLASDIQRVEGTANSAASAATAASQLAYTIADVYDSAETYAVGKYAIYQNTLYKCVTAILIGEPFDSTKWTSVKVMDEIPSGGGGSVDADDVSYDNTSSGLTATNVQDAIDEVKGLIPSIVSNTEVQRGTLTAGQTSVVLTFTEQTISATTLVDWYVDGGMINPTAIATTSTTVTLTFEAQASDLGVSVKVQN